MKLWYQPQSVQGRVMHNIANEVRKYSPSNIQWTKDWKEADLVIENIYGDHKSVKARNNDEIMEHITKKPFGIMFHGFAIPKQYVLQNEFFNWLFKNAKFIYSPWDVTGYYGFKLDNFMRGAWGLNSNEFYRTPNAKKRYTITATGCVSSTEAIQEIYEACKVIGGFNFDPKYYENKENISTEEVRLIFNASKYVAGFRRAEGFELPAIEAGACGVRPVCFDNPHYTDWFKDFAYFIEESTALHVTDQLVELFSKEPEPISEELRLNIAKRFDWKTLCLEMWKFIGRRI